jgi:hypothetical protein
MTMPEVTGRRVRFSVVEEIEYEVEEFTAEEKDQLWYTMEDMVALAKFEIKLCEENNRKAGCTWRGLEHMQTGEDVRQPRVAQILDAILDAYDDIYADDMTNEADKVEQLRDACRALTREDRKSAYKWGLRDQSVAVKIYEEENASKRKHVKVKKTVSTSSNRSPPTAKRVRSRDAKLVREVSPVRQTICPATNQLHMNPIPIAA